mgnify:CR=1 FL=1
MYKNKNINKMMIIVKFFLISAQVFIKKFLNYSRRRMRSGYDDTNRHPYIHLYNNNYITSSHRDAIEDGNFYKYLGSNVYRDITINGYHYNACDIYLQT